MRKQRDAVNKRDWSRLEDLAGYFRRELHELLPFTVFQWKGSVRLVAHSTDQPSVDGDKVTLVAPHHLTQAKNRLAHGIALHRIVSYTPAHRGILPYNSTEACYSRLILIRLHRLMAIRVLLLGALREEPCTATRNTRTQATFCPRS